MNIRIAFLVWNSFQLIHIKSLLKQIPSAVLIIEKRKKSQPIPSSILSEVSNSILDVDSQDVHHKVEDFFDILIIQTVFEKIFLLEKTKIVMLQYGYAKEPHNYGAWRALADLNLVYGKYAADKISYFSPVEIIGYPRSIDWNDPSFRENARNKYKKYLDSDKKTILYAPSWGELSSFDCYIKSIVDLQDEYTVLVKLHHNTVLLNSEYEKDIEGYDKIKFFFQNDDILELLAVSDIVLSDFSGAIFDAIYCNKPVFLLSIEKHSEKLDTFSIEISQRDMLGYIVNSPSELSTQIKHHLVSNSSNYLYNDLFFYIDSNKAFLSSIENLISGKYQLSQHQLYIRNFIKKALSEINALKRRKTLFEKIVSFFNKK
ncbi:CDP-glycerol glycerophosphotransferase family protein [Avibacterium sp. 21-595]|uniref:CDP-glycerol glycerophosphotransferase family protein n=1 Tax=Avibacterium sp. 21-595 TaxID=2911527 RepID=UPI002025D61D|nr:CDP-glycerol glycerophosphotransferase family protein [Avibacterium sp. 21-595]URL07454.1 CDP-glycerol glycerophosphotransferase family protein [Avibacterium sp. 21-595]